MCIIFTTLLKLIGQKLNKIMSIKLNRSDHTYLINKACKPYCTKQTVQFQSILNRAACVLALFRVCIFTVSSVNKLIFTM